MFELIADPSGRVIKFNIKTKLSEVRNCFFLHSQQFDSFSGSEMVYLISETLFGGDFSKDFRIGIRM
jgi:hypothetical protein